MVIGVDGVGVSHRGEGKATLTLQCEFIGLNAVGGCHLTCRCQVKPAIMNCNYRKRCMLKSEEQWSDKWLCPQPIDLIHGWVNDETKNKRQQ